MQNLYPAIQVFLIAPPMTSWGLERLLETAHPRMLFSGSSEDITAAMPELERLKPDVVMAVLDEDTDMEELALLPSKGANVLVVTTLHDVAVLDQVVMCGVRGVVHTSDAPAALLKAIEKVHQGELWIDRRATGRIFLQMARKKAAQGMSPEDQKIATLTSRERQTIAAVAGDAKAPAKVIASRLCISEHTLRNHLTSIYSKLELSNRLDLYAYATRHRLVDSMQGLR
ncbi:MAG: response regulator transcription factor [Pseudomonadota bacterium]